jgi:uncharacterized membrane protein YgcG
MLRRFTLFFLLLLSSSFFFQLSAQELPPRPAKYTPVNVPTNTLTSEEIALISDSLIAFEKRTTTQIVVVVVNQLNGYTIEDYANKLYNAWGIGQGKDQNNGALLLVALVERKIRIEVGYGLEAKITDAAAANIIAEKITPSFKENKYFDGIRDGVFAMVARAEGGDFNRTLLNAPVLEQFWIRALLAVLIFALIFSREKDWASLATHTVGALLLLGCTDKLFWEAIGFEPQTHGAAAVIGSFFAFGFWLPALGYLAASKSTGRYRPISPVSTIIYMGVAFSVYHIAGLAFLEAIGYTIFSAGFFALWAWNYAKMTDPKKLSPAAEQPTLTKLAAAAAKADSSKTPSVLLPPSSMSSEMSFYAFLLYIIATIIIYIPDALGLTFMSHPITHLLFAILIAMLITSALAAATPKKSTKKAAAKSTKKGKTYGSKRDNYSDYSDYKDYSDYSDSYSDSKSSYSDYSDSYSDSSWGGGSSGGGGASGGW